MRQLLHDLEEQMERELYEQDDQTSLSSTEVEEHLPEQGTLLGPYRAATPEEDTKDDGTPITSMAEDMGLHTPALNSLTLTDDQARECYQMKEQEQRGDVRCIPAGLAPETLRARHLWSSWSQHKQLSSCCCQILWFEDASCSIGQAIFSWKSYRTLIPIQL